MLKRKDSPDNVELLLQSAGLMQRATYLRDSAAAPARRLPEQTVWHNADNIATLTGLEGTFYWGENPAESAVITFNFDKGAVGFKGEYTLEGRGVYEKGAFFSVPNNPAVGWASVTLMPAAGDAARNFIVYGAGEEAGNIIDILLLSSLDGNTPVMPPFCCLRKNEEEL